MLILFVEYHAAFRQSASLLMDREPDMEAVSQAGSVAEGRENMLGSGAAEVLGKDATFAEVLAAVRRLGGEEGRGEQR